MKDNSPVMGGADGRGVDGTTASVTEPPDVLDEAHDGDGGLDLYDIDAEY